MKSIGGFIALVILAQPVFAQSTLTQYEKGYLKGMVSTARVIEIGPPGPGDPYYQFINLFYRASLASDVKSRIAANFQNFQSADLKTMFTAFMGQFPVNYGLTAQNFNLWYQAGWLQNAYFANAAKQLDEFIQKSLGGPADAAAVNSPEGVHGYLDGLKVIATSLYDMTYVPAFNADPQVIFRLAEIQYYQMQALSNVITSQTSQFTNETFKNDLVQMNQPYLYKFTIYRPDLITLAKTKLAINVLIAEGLGKLNQLADKNACVKAFDNQTPPSKPQLPGAK